MWRQGDLLIRKATARPHNAFIPVRDGVVLRGDTSGHAHRLQGGLLETAEFPRNAIWFATVGEDGAVLSHEEHGPIELEVGNYIITRQREYIGDGDWSDVED